MYYPTAMSNSAGIGSHDPPPFSFAFSTGGGGVYSGNVNSGRSNHFLLLTCPFISILYLGSLGDDTTLLHTDVFENHFENHFQVSAGFSFPVYKNTGEQPKKDNNTF